MPFWIALIAGTTFGVGLTISGMVNPERVLGFLDITGDWDPALALVMLGALTVTVPTFVLSRRRLQPILAETFQWPIKSAIDTRLIVGAVVFGAGWGIAGYCPGPGLASMLLGYGESYWFVVSMMLATWLSRLWLTGRDTA